MSAVRRRLASSWLGLLVLACGAQTEPGSLELARKLAVGEPSIARALAHGGLEARDNQASSAEQAMDPFVRVPDRADGTFEVRAGARAAPLAQLRSLDASAAPLELVEGVAMYRGAVSGFDALWLLRSNALEQLLLVPSAPRELRFGWELCHAERLAAVRQTPALGLVFSDGHGTDRLRIPPPFALDARGQRRELSLQYRAESAGCGRVDFTLDARGLAPPLLVDPALEAVVWTDRTDPDHKPVGRFGHGLAYDPVRNKTVLFGGSVNGPPPFLDDTWEWDGDAWHDVSPTNPPEGRLYHDLAYSSVHGGAVLVGGLPQLEFVSAKNDVWLWNGAWTELAPGGDELPILYGHGLAFDSAREQLVLYGGYGEDENRHVWELDGAGWKDRGELAISPGSVDMFSMAYDAAHERTFVFGGVSPAGVSDNPFVPRSDQTYLWSGNGWSSVTAKRPSPRSGMASAYDSKRGRIVLFGGTDGEFYDDETWEYADGSFEHRRPLRSPPARESARMAYDAARDRVVLFGGFGDSDGDDTWTYAHFGNTCRDDADCDGEACVDGVCCQDKVCGSCEACNEQTGRCAPVVSRDDENSGCSGERSCDATGACLPSDGQTCRKDSECASGHCVEGLCCDQACDGVCQACTRGVCRFVTDAEARGACPGSGACASHCDGKQADCSPIPEGRDCGTSCEDAVLSVKACDARGACRSRAPQECADHLLCQDETSCLERCASSDDCSQGFECRSGACIVLTARCVDETTVDGPGGREDCGAYACASGKCRTSCARASDCRAGLVCNEEGQCLTPEAAVIPPEHDDSGCGCRSAAGRPTPEAWLAGLALVLVRRRRRVA